MPSSELSGFYKKSVKERVELVAGLTGLSEEEKNLLEREGALDFATANRMIENVYGVHCLPLGLATNFKVNAVDYLVPFVLEEPSVVAAASHAAKLCRATGGFTADADSPVMLGQVQLVHVSEPEKAVKNILGKKKELLELAKSKDSILA